MDPWKKIADWSDEKILRVYNDPAATGKFLMYDELAIRANRNKAIESLLLSVVNSEEAQKEIVMGFIKHSWLPSISILKYGHSGLLNSLLRLLKAWPEAERFAFKNYLATDEFLSEKIQSI